MIRNYRKKAGKESRKLPNWLNKYFFHCPDLLQPGAVKLKLFCLSSVIIGVRVVFRKTVVGDWRFDHMNGSHLQSQGQVIYHKSFSFRILRNIVWLHFHRTQQSPVRESRVLLHILVPIHGESKACAVASAQVSVRQDLHYRDMHYRCSCFCPLYTLACTFLRAFLLRPLYTLPSKSVYGPF